jgi:hypothetical protein
LANEKLNGPIGVNQSIDRLTIQWPSGLVALFENMKANHYYIIEEGGKPSILQY